MFLTYRALPGNAAVMEDRSAGYELGKADGECWHQGALKFACNQRGVVFAVDPQGDGLRIENPNFP